MKYAANAHLSVEVLKIDPQGSMMHYKSIYIEENQAKTKIKTRSQRWRSSGRVLFFRHWWKESKCKVAHNWLIYLLKC